MKNKRHRKVAFEVLKKIGLVELLFHLSRYQCPRNMVCGGGTLPIDDASYRSIRPVKTLNGFSQPNDFWILIITFMPNHREWNDQFVLMLLFNGNRQSNQIWM